MVTEPDQHPDELATGVWTELRPDALLTVVKLAPDGAEVARYPGKFIAGLSQGSWIVAHATWTNRTVALDGLSFCPGDDLLEWFSPRHPFNAFAVFSRGGQFKGWYANVTHPARLDLAAKPPLLTWHDLYVDLVGLPDKTFTIRDEDELLASGLGDLDPELHGHILAARTELIQRFEKGQLPFIDVSSVAPNHTHWGQNAPIS